MIYELLCYCCCCAIFFHSFSSNIHFQLSFAMVYAFLCCRCWCVFLFFPTSASGSRLIWCMRFDLVLLLLYVCVCVRVVFVVCFFPFSLLRALPVVVLYGVCRSVLFFFFFQRQPRLSFDILYAFMCCYCCVCVRVFFFLSQRSLPTVIWYDVCVLCCCCL